MVNPAAKSRPNGFEAILMLSITFRLLITSYDQGARRSGPLWLDLCIGVPGEALPSSTLFAQAHPRPHATTSVLRSMTRMPCIMPSDISLQKSRSFGRAAHAPSGTRAWGFTGQGHGDLRGDLSAAAQNHNQAVE